MGKIKKNKEYCEACRDGGELVCCERCPISYHPTCCDPPCDASDLPDKWICRQCLQGRDFSGSNSPDEKSVYNSLASDAAKVNPTQFSIPSNIGASVSLPGMARPKPSQVLNYQSVILYRWPNYKTQNLALYMAHHFLKWDRQRPATVHVKKCGFFRIEPKFWEFLEVTHKKVAVVAKSRTIHTNFSILLENVLS